MLTARGKEAAQLLVRFAALAIALRELEPRYDSNGSLVPDWVPVCPPEREQPKAKKKKRRHNTHDWIDEDGDMCTPLALGPNPPQYVKDTWEE